MKDADDAEYHRNARNMAIVLAVLIVTAFAAIFVPPLVNPVHEQFSTEVSASSPYGFELSLMVQPTSVAPGGQVTVTVWLNNTGTEVNNLTAASSWPIEGLLQNQCPSGNPLPFGVGILQGYYTSDNATFGQPLRLMGNLSCTAAAASPAYFALAPQGSHAVVRYDGALQAWDLNSSLSLTGYYAGAAQFVRFQGVYTVVAADEWGDLAVTHFKSLG